MTIYTAIFGPYDDLKEPMVITPGWKYICFTDQDFTSDVWEIRKVPVMPFGPAKTARYYKINHFKNLEDELTIWIDGTFIINTDLDEWWKRFTAPFTAVKHPFDNCIYTDAQACLDSGRGEKQLLQRQIRFYRVLGVKKNNGLIASGVLMRQRCATVNKFCHLWWEQVKKWSNRDQIAYGFANHQMPGTLNLIDWNYTTEKEFIHIPHLNRSWRKHVLKQLRNGKSQSV